MHWATYVIFQDLKIIEEFDSMGPTPSGIVLKGLYRWLFLENKRLGIHLDSSEFTGGRILISVLVGRCF
jgi:Ulp1 family protease